MLGVWGESPRHTARAPVCAFRRREALKPERVTGIEPAFTAWEAVILPLNYTRMIVLSLHERAGTSSGRGRAGAAGTSGDRGRLGCPGAAE